MRFFNRLKDIIIEGIKEGVEGFIYMIEDVLPAMVAFTLLAMCIFIPIGVMVGVMVFFTK